MLFRDLRWTALVPIGALAACTSLLGNDFTIVDGSGGSGATGTGTGTAGPGGSGGAGGTGAGMGGSGGTGGGGVVYPPLVCEWTLANHFPAADIPPSGGYWFGRLRGFRVGMDRARAIIGRGLVTAGPQIEVHTFDAASTTHDVVSFSGDAILDTRRVSFSSIGVLYTEFVGNFNTLRLRSISDSGASSGSTTDLATLNNQSFPGIDTSYSVEGLMTQVGANEVDIAVSYRDGGGAYRLYLLRYANGTVTPTEIATGLSNNAAEITAITHHDGITYVYAGQAAVDSKMTQYRLDPTMGVNESRELEPASSGIFAYGSASGMADRFSVVTFDTQVELRAGEVPATDLDSFQFTDLNVSGTWATIGDIPVNYGGYTWLDRTFMMLGAPEGDTSQMNYFIMGPNGAVLAEAGLPFTGNLAGGITRDIDEVAVIKRDPTFPPEGGDVHAVWIEEQDDGTGQRQQMYYDILSCTPR